MEPEVSSAKSRTVLPGFGERFTHRLEAFSDPDPDMRLREWRGTVRQYGIVLLIVASLIGMHAGAIPQEKFYSLVPTAFIAVIVITRVTVRRLPKFLE